MCACIIEFVVLFKMLSCNALSVVSGTCLFADCWEVVKIMIRITVSFPEGLYIEGT
jgi:hypothetical protein